MFLLTEDFEKNIYVCITVMKNQYFNQRSNLKL